MSQTTGHHLTIICGLPGSGKSHHGRRLAAKTGTMLLDIDTVTEPVVRAGLTLAGMSDDDRDSVAFKQAYRTPIYQALFDTARENLNHCDVIVCGPFTQELQQEHWAEELAVQLGANIHIVYLYCQPKVRKQRIEARANPRDRQKLQRWEEFGVASPVPKCKHQFVDTSVEAV